MAAATSLRLTRQRKSLIGRPIQSAEGSPPAGPAPTANATWEASSNSKSRSAEAKARPRRRDFVFMA